MNDKRLPSVSSAPCSEKRRLDQALLGSSCQPCLSSCQPCLYAMAPVEEGGEQHRHQEERRDQSEQDYSGDSGHEPCEWHTRRCCWGGRRRRWRRGRQAGEGRGARRGSWQLVRVEDEHLAIGACASRSHHCDLVGCEGDRGAEVVGGPHAHWAVQSMSQVARLSVEADAAAARAGVGVGYQGEKAREVTVEAAAAVSSDSRATSTSTLRLSSPGKGNGPTKLRAHGLLEACPARSEGQLRLDRRRSRAREVENGRVHRAQARLATANSEPRRADEELGPAIVPPPPILSSVCPNRVAM